MSTKLNEIDRLKALPPLTQHVCGNCAFYQPHPGIVEWSGCRALNIKANVAWQRCQAGMWQERRSVLARFKRWLFG